MGYDRRERYQTPTTRTVATGWYAEPAVTGVIIRSIAGKMVARVASGNIYFWDRDNRTEISVPLDELMRLSIGE